MKSISPLLERLINSFCCLPGVGPKSAQRMVFHLLQRDRQGAKTLYTTLANALEDIGHCTQCRIFSETTLCQICQNPKRQSDQLCIVESPGDVLAIEQTNSFRGHYFVLLGHLSPLDGIGPDDIGLDILKERFQQGEINEIILATNPTVEGEATAYYIAEMARANHISASRIAYGVPLGGELEYVDGGTLIKAFEGRAEIIGE